jgi:putative ABC transport system substrate-binding protein
VLRSARAAGALVLTLALCVASAGAAPLLVGILPLGSPNDAYDVSLVDAFRQGLRDHGVVEGRDITLEVTWTRGDSDELAQNVLKLKQRGARLLVPTGTDASMAVKRQAPGVPILFISVGNPLGLGLVDNLGRPGGHVTGFADNLADLGGKYVQFATEIVKSSTVHYLWYDGWSDGLHRLQVTERGAQELGVKLRPRPISDIRELDEAMAAFKKAGASVVIAQPSPFTYLHRARIVESGLSHGVVTIGAFQPAARAGALVSYGPDYADLNRRAAGYLARILRGTKPGDLPVEQPTKFELVVNLKTARVAGIALPASLRERANLVLE